jgi:competence protein ComEC
VAGIYLGSIFHIHLALIACGIIPLPFIFFYKKYRKYLITLSLSLVVLFGAAFYYPNSIPKESAISLYNNQSVSEIRGTIASPPEVRDNTTHIELAVKEIKLEAGWAATSGEVLLFVPRYPEYRYGDSLWLHGKIENPPQFDGFNYQAYLKQQNIFSVMLNPQIKVLETNTSSKPLEWIYSFRERLSGILAQSLPEPQASLSQGILLGQRSTIPETLKTELSVTGTAHLLAISGINLSIVAGLLVALGIWIFGRRRYYYVWPTLAFIWFYALLTGMQAPVIRSAIMASIFLFAELLGRQKNTFVALAFSAAIMVGINPQVLWSISFQLSFLSMVGLVLIAPHFQSWSRALIHGVIGDEGVGVSLSRFILDSFSVTLGALIFVWPLIAYYFSTISLVGPVATFLASPSLPAIIFSCALTAIVGLVNSSAAHVIGWSAWLFLSYMLWMVQSFASLPLSSIRTGAINPGWVWLYYAILAILIFINAFKLRLLNFITGLITSVKSAGNRSLELYSRFPKKFVIIPLLVIALISSLSASILPDNNLHVSFLDVGEGDSILIQDGNQSILIDGGPSPQAVCTGLSEKLPFWDRDIDLVILTHPHLDHLSGLIEVLKRYDVKQVLAPELSSDTPAYQEWLDLIKSKNIKLERAFSGRSVSLQHGARLEILNPPDQILGKTESNLENDGIVVHLKFNEISFLFTADIGQTTESKLVLQRADIQSTVLKVAHHGSATSSSTNFLTIANPQIAVISTGAENPFGHPDSQTISRLKDQVNPKGNIFRTDESGTIEFVTDGHNLTVKTQKD